MRIKWDDDFVEFKGEIYRFTDFEVIFKGKPLEGVSEADDVYKYVVYYELVPRKHQIPVMINGKAWYPPMRLYTNDKGEILPADPITKEGRVKIRLKEGATPMSKERYEWLLKHKRPVSK